MNEILMQIVINMIYFFANCSDEVVCEDNAVKMLEEISFFMKKLNSGEKEEFITFTKKIGDELKEQDIEKANFYYMIPENLGLK